MGEEGRPFEEALAELEKIVRDLEAGNLGLDEALARYESGVGLVRECHGRLRDAEQRILVLTGLAEDGTPDTAPFAHQATADQVGGPIRAEGEPPTDPPVPTRKRASKRTATGGGLFGE